MQMPRLTTPYLRRPESYGSILVVAIALLLTALDWVLLPTHQVAAVAFTVLHCLLIIALLPSPTVAAFLLVALHIAWMFTTHGEAGTTQLWGVWAGLGLAAEKNTKPYTILLPLLCTTASFIERSVIRDQSVSSSLMIVLTYWCAWLLGRLIQTTHQRDLSRSKQQQMEREEKLAAQIHDSLSAELSCLMLQSRRNAADHTFDDHARAEFTQMAVRAADALRDVRDIVHSLSSDEADTADMIPPTQSIFETARHCELMLHRIGFSGSVLVQDNLGSLDPLTSALVNGVLTELTANMIRHGKAADFGLTARIGTNNHLDIRAWNQIGSDCIMPESGYGLQTMRERVRRRTGTVTVTQSSGIWDIQVSIPLQYGRSLHTAFTKRP